jgi:outer membrane murein-binding lipoprotein Lpp
MRVTTYSSLILALTLLSGCAPADQIDQASAENQPSAQMELAGKLLRGESPRERAGGE